MTYAEIKQELGVKKLEFFNVLNEAGEASEWNRAQTLPGDFILLHNETIPSLTPEAAGLFLKRKEDRVFEDGIPHRVFVLCKSDKTAAFAG